MTGPTALTDRAAGPDLARGFMLLFIALANSHYFLAGRPVLGGYPEGGTAADRAVVWLLTTFVDGRAFPMFALLLGFGAARLTRRGDPRPLRRRGAILAVVGLADALLFYVGDILAAYGLLLILAVWLARWTDRTLLIVAMLFLVLNGLPDADASTISRAGPDLSMLPPDPLTQLRERAVVWVYVGLLGPVGFLAPFLVGLWAGRRELGSRFLRSVAVAGVVVAVLGAQPIALRVAGESPVAASLHGVSGVLGGLGYAALLTVVAQRWRGRVRDAIVAAGRSSLTCYLMQSVAWAVVFTPYLLDLSGTLSVTGCAALAAGVWVVSVLVASRMPGRGPFEALVRRVTYRGSVGLSK